MLSAYCLGECDSGFFKIGDMRGCRPWLSCDDIKNMEIGNLIGYGAVKQVYQSTWNNQTVAFVYINNQNFVDDFRTGLELLKAITPSKFIVQLIGFCSKADVYITEYYPLGNCMNIQKVFSERNITSLKKRFQLCVDYVGILDFLHNSPLGTRVMCDSNTLNKTLEQYLITSPLSLVLNDIDAVPEVRREGIVCGHKEITGSFVAPEQKWPFGNEEYEERRMPTYDEKIDVWKIPAVCNYFLGKSEAAKLFRYHVYQIHRRCREKLPQKRPSAREVLKFYVNVLHQYFAENVYSDKEEL